MRSVKSRYFVTAPLRPELVPKPTSPRLAGRNLPTKTRRKSVAVKQSKRKRAESEGNDEHLDEFEWSTEESEDMDEADPIPREPRPVRKQRRIITATCQEDSEEDAEDIYQDVAMTSPPPEMGGGSSKNPRM